MPIGPIDPTHIIQAIQNGATWRDDRIWYQDALNYLAISSGQWVFQVTAGHKVKMETYGLLARATPNTNGTFTAGNVTYQLVSTTDTAGQSWASPQRI
jgi:hypothetical protein